MWVAADSRAQARHGVTHQRAYGYQCMKNKLHAYVLNLFFLVFFTRKEMFQDYFVFVKQYMWPGVPKNCQYLRILISVF